MILSGVLQIIMRRRAGDGGRERKVQEVSEEDVEVMVGRGGGEGRGHT